MDELIETLKNDNKCFESWQENIAMCFYDEYYRQKRKQTYLNKQELYSISNNAAKNFLNNLLKDKTEKEGE